MNFERVSIIITGSRLVSERRMSSKKFYSASIDIEVSAKKVSKAIGPSVKYDRLHNKCREGSFINYGPILKWVSKKGFQIYRPILKWVSRKSFNMWRPILKWVLRKGLDNVSKLWTNIEKELPRERKKKLIISHHNPGILYSFSLCGLSIEFLSVPLPLPFFVPPLVPFAVVLLFGVEHFATGFPFLFGFFLCGLLGFSFRMGDGCLHTRFLLLLPLHRIVVGHVFVRMVSHVFFLRCGESFLEPVPGPAFL